LLALLLPKAIEMAIGGLATLLKKAGDKDTAQLTADEFTDLYLANDKQVLTPNPNLGCLLGVWFETRDNNFPREDDAVRKLKAARLVPANAVVGGIFEASIRIAGDGTAFFLDTRHFSVRDFFGRRNKDERDYLVTLSVSTPGATAEGNTFALGKIELGRRREGDSIVPADHPEDALPRYRSNLMPWSKISESSKAAYDRDVSAGHAAGRRYMPVTFSLTVTETADGNAFLLKLGELLGASADKMAAEISKQVLPSEIEKAAAESAAGAEKLYEEEQAAHIKVLEAQRAYDAGTDPAEKPVLQAKLDAARRKLAYQTKLREAAGLPPR
jgi:hypothetical protein